MKNLFGGSHQSDWDNFVSFTLSGNASDATEQRSTPSQTPTVARVAQATTIVAGGITASLVAEMAGRPFKACQRISQNATESSAHPIRDVYRTQGSRPFLFPDAVKMTPQSKRLSQVAKRVGWRLAAVGPWGLGFLVWAWVGGEV